jgi:DNA-binding XRE family transcriptional regulator
MKHIKEITESFYNFSSEDLKSLRKTMYKTQQEMANVLGWKDRSSICFYEKGNRMSKQKALLCNLLKNYMEKNYDN